MSAFGYGSSYMPSWRGNIQATTNAQTPGFGVAPEMARPNFNPVATSPWQGDSSQSGFRESNPNAAQAEMYNYSGPLVQGSGPNGGATAESMAKDNFSMWRNPLDALFPRQGQPFMDASGNAKGYTMGRDAFTPGGMVNQQLLNIGINDTNYAQNNQLGSKSGAPGAPLGRNPTDAKQLYEQIGGLSMDQLMRMTGGGNTLSDKFNTVAQDYKNAYANPNFAAGARSTSGYDESQQLDWLQQSYNSTVKRMDNNFLL